jgi:hypothetical protein
MVLLASGVSWNRRNIIKTRDKVKKAFHQLPIPFQKHHLFSYASPPNPTFPKLLISQYPSSPISQLFKTRIVLLRQLVSVIRPVPSSAAYQDFDIQKAPHLIPRRQAYLVPSLQSWSHISKLDRCC